MPSPTRVQAAPEICRRLLPTALAAWNAILHKFADKTPSLDRGREFLLGSIIGHENDPAYVARFERLDRQTRHPSPSRHTVDSHPRRSPFPLRLPRRPNSCPPHGIPIPFMLPISVYVAASLTAPSDAPIPTSNPQPPCHSSSSPSQHPHDEPHGVSVTDAVGKAAEERKAQVMHEVQELFNTGLISKAECDLRLSEVSHEAHLQSAEKPKHPLTSGTHQLAHPHAANLHRHLSPSRHPSPSRHSDHHAHDLSLQEALRAVNEKAIDTAIFNKHQAEAYRSPSPEAGARFRERGFNAQERVKQQARANGLL